MKTIRFACIFRCNFPYFASMCRSTWIRCAGAITMTNKTQRTQRRQEHHINGKLFWLLCIHFSWQYFQFFLLRLQTVWVWVCVRWRFVLWEFVYAGCWHRYAGEWVNECEISCACEKYFPMIVCVSAKLMQMHWQCAVLFCLVYSQKWVECSQTMWRMTVWPPKSSYACRMETIASVGMTLGSLNRKFDKIQCNTTSGLEKTQIFLVNVAQLIIFIICCCAFPARTKRNMHTEQLKQNKNSNEMFSSDATIRMT